MMNQLRNLVASTLGIPVEAVSESLARGHEPSWDSFNHLMLLTEVEKAFKVRFTVDEPERIRTFADLHALIQAKLIP